MADITISATPGEFFTTVAPPQIEIKEHWTDSWAVVPEMELVEATLAACGDGLSSCVIQRRYGLLKQPWDAAFSTYAKLSDLSGWWLRVSLSGDSGYVTTWVGQIQGVGDERHGSQSHAPSGIQTWQAYGPLAILKRMSMWVSYWKVGTETKLIQWVPGMNDRDNRGWLVGNRSNDEDATLGVYLYGDKAIWSNLDYLKYVVKIFLDDPTGVRWTVGGQTDVIEFLQTTLNFSTTQTLDTVIRSLVSTKHGVDYCILPTEDGFEITLFAICPSDVTFGSTTLPANANSVTIATGINVQNVQTRIAYSNEHGYGRLFVLGKRVTVCCSLYGTSASAPEGSTGLLGTLEAKWDSALEWEYEAADDEGRQSDRFDSVFQNFGAKTDWDWNGGTALPLIGDDGQFDADATAPDYQMTVRRTLHALPLKEYYDYSANPAVNNSPAGYESGYMPVIAWIGYESTGSSSALHYRPAHELGISVSVAQTDWGVHLGASPNHVIAQGTMGGTSDVDPLYDWRRTVVTLAMLSDQRFGFRLEDPNAKPEDGLLAINVDDAELWYLAPHTMVGTDATNAPLYSGSTGIVLRNDATRLTLIAAGAVARYFVGRKKAEITAKMLMPWAEILSYTLAYVGDPTALEAVGCPVTHISWHVDKKTGAGTTTVKAGYAL